MKQRACKHKSTNRSIDKAQASRGALQDKDELSLLWTCAHTPRHLHAHKPIYPVSLWTEWTSQTFLSSSQWGQPAWPLGVTNMQFTQPDSRGSSESVHSRTRERERERNVRQKTAAIQTTVQTQLPCPEKLQNRCTGHTVTSSFHKRLTVESEQGLLCPTTVNYSLLAWRRWAHKRKEKS